MRGNFMRYSMTKMRIIVTVVRSCHDRSYSCMLSFMSVYDHP